VITLESDCIILFGQLRGSKFDHRFMLRELSPHYESFSRRYWTFIVFPFCLLGAMAFFWQFAMRQGGPGNC